MPIRLSDPFQDALEHLSSAVNPYVELLREGVDGRLPLLYGPALRPWPGHWRSHYAAKMGCEPEALLLEIGSHYGEVILKMASQHPQTAFLGLDITFKRVVKLAQKAKRQELANLTSLLANARGLEHLFAPQELDGVVIFFPDPWAKKSRQSKHRLVDAEFLGILAQKIRPGGYLWFKTDCEPYFEAVAAQLKASAWQPQDPQQGLAAEIYTSRFERRFRDKGEPTYELVCQPPVLPHRASEFFS